MKKTIAVTLTALATAFTAAHATIVLGASFGDQTDNATSTWTVSNLNAATPTAAGTNSPNISGSLSGAGAFGVSEQFSITFTPFKDWDSAAANTAVTNNTLSSYIGGLTSGDRVEAANSGYGVNTGAGDSLPDEFSGTNEMLLLTFNTSNLNATTTLTFNDIGWQKATATDKSDFWFFDVSANLVTKFLDDGRVIDVSSSVFGQALENGDQLIIATSSSNTDNWRFDSITVNAIPEPTSFSLIAGLLATSLLGRRRRAALRA